MKHILLISHQRSGTHLAIDMIRNNLSDYSCPYISIKEIYKRRSNLYEKDIFLRMANNPLVFKLHATSNYSDEYFDYPFLNDLIKYLIEEAIIVYIHREPKDVLVSLFFHYLNMYPELKKYTLEQFIFSPIGSYSFSHNGINRLDYWIKHIQGWLFYSSAIPIQHLAFEDIINNYEKTIYDMCRYLNTACPNRITDVRAKSIDTSQLSRRLIAGNISYTAVNFRKGAIGDYKNHMSTNVIERIDLVTQFYREKF